MSDRPDFADWLSPMLVKELRQGMRSRAFMAAFYLTQLLMILGVVFTLAALGGDGSTADLSTFLNSLFWLMISVPLLFVMPIRGFGALHGEIRGGTMELVFLTRLSAWRIAAGKWLALLAQTLLLVCAVLPYVLLRYFLGGVNIVEDLQNVLFLVVASAALTALTIALSPYESKLLRVLFTIGLIFSLQFIPWMLFAWMSLGRMTGAGGGLVVSWQIYLCIVAYIPAFIFLALEIAASRIAPAAENHAIRKRLLGFYFLLAAPILAFLGIEPVAVYGASLFFLAIVIIDALAEPGDFLPGIYRFFLQWKTCGRAMALVLAPGWVSAAWYVFTVTAAALAVSWTQNQLDTPDQALTGLAYLGALIFPAAVIRTVAPNTKHFLGFYIALQFFVGAVTFLVTMIGGITNRPLTAWLSPLPGSTLMLQLANQIKPEQVEEFLSACGMVTSASLALLLLRTVTPLRDIRARISQIEK